MIFRQLDANGDWTYGKGIQNFARGQQAVALNLATLIRCWTGDCFFDIPKGINWKQLLNYGQQANLDAALQGLILQAYGVVSLVSAVVNFSSSTRKLAASYTVNTIFSTTVTNNLSILSNTTEN